MTYPYPSMHQSGVNTVPNLAQYGQYDPYQSVARQTQNQHQPPTLQPLGYTPNITVPMTQSYIQPPTQQIPNYNNQMYNQSLNSLNKSLFNINLTVYLSLKNPFSLL